ncbi:MAG: TolC family protein [Kiritimatiellales bacterium]
MMKKFVTKKYSAGAVLLLLCTSCALLPKKERAAPDDLPDAWRAESAGIATTNEWWKAFGDEQLNRLMERALGNNLTIEQAAARLRQAEAAAVKSGAARFPSADGSARAGSEYRHTDRAGTVTTDDYQLGLSASYEVDLWGRVASTRRAALYDLKASRFDLETAAMTIAAQTAGTYFEWQYLQCRLAVLKEQLKTNRQMLSVVEKRFETSQSSSLDIFQQRRQVFSAAAALQPVKAALSAAGNALAVLIGEMPQTELNLTVLPLPAIPAWPDAGIPAVLLERRPDLQAKWALLESADHTVRAARADRLPAITLTASASYRDDSMNGLFDNWVKNLAAGVTAPLIDGGRRRAEVRRVKAVVDERAAAYRAAVLSAFGEVENALTAEKYQQEYVAKIRRQYGAAESAAEEAYRRYTRGLESYFDALTMETIRQNLEVTVLAAEYELLTDRIQLYRVLGGDWGEILKGIRE